VVKKEEVRKGKEEELPSEEKIGRAQGRGRVISQGGRKGDRENKQKRERERGGGQSDYLRIGSVSARE
jgi:hypothetical protein